MKFAEFKKAGHWPTLLAAFLYFDISFMAWVALGPLMVYIAHDMNLAVSEKFTLVAIPVLAGALLRVPMGVLADIIGAKRAGIIAQLIVTAATPGCGVRARQQACDPDLRPGARRRRRVLRGGAAPGQPLVSAAISGHRDGYRRRGQHGRCDRYDARTAIAEHFGWQAVFGFLLIPMVLVLAYSSSRPRTRRASASRSR